jgi:hypothetical protein
MQTGSPIGNRFGKELSILEKASDYLFERGIPSALAFALIAALTGLCIVAPSFLVMVLWNWLCPPIFALPVLNFPQTLGLVVLVYFFRLAASAVGLVVLPFHALLGRKPSKD